MSAAEIKSIDCLLDLNLDIPDYQRPYKWDIHNIIDLLNDIENAIQHSAEFGPTFKYRVGTIILHKDNQGALNVVDGQQRVISLTLIKRCLDSSFTSSILNENRRFSNKSTQLHIHDNYAFLHSWFSLKSSKDKDKFRKAFSEILEVVVIYVSETSEAFQLFDSQNTRGKELYPHDLLKAYHLREMKHGRIEDEKIICEAVADWESYDTKQIKELFDSYLYPIWNWSKRYKSKTFTAKEIDVYKGITTSSDYSYAHRAQSASPHFQLTEPFIAGSDFFSMVEHYLGLLDCVKGRMENDPAFADIQEILSLKDDSAGFRYTKNLFYCALLCYYDKFNNFDEMAVKKLFTWAFMLRVDMKNLGFSSVNKYAIGEGENSRYTNTLPVFSLIESARLHTEISGLKVQVVNENGAEKWKPLQEKLQVMNGLREVAHD